MDDRELAARQLASQMAVFEAEVAGGRGSSALRPVPGVLATVCPAVPRRSLPNSVLYEHAAALSDPVLDELEAVYESAEVRAWTVWVHPGDDELAARLRLRGHVHDAEPMLMASEIDPLDVAPRRELDLDPDPDWRTIADLNDRAYGLEGEIARVLDGVEDEVAERWIAMVDGEPAACVVVRPHDGNAEVFWVAVVPEARGRGLSGELMRRALSSAAMAGCTTTSLEATALGEPVYLGLGYRPLGRFGMWERRAL
jgi:GNAT superfamily N-acetyltransferase